MKRSYDIGQFVNAQTEQSVMNDLVKRFKKRRKEKGLTQKQMAEQSGMSYSSLRRFEQTGEIAIASLLKLAKVLGCLEDFNLLFKTPIITDLRNYKND